MTEPTIPIPSLVGNAIALEFSNSVDDRGTPRERDYVPDLPSFRAWCQAVGLPVNEGAADVDIAEVHALRDAVVAVANAAALDKSPPQEALAEINRHVPRLQLAWTDDGFALDPGAPAGTLRAALGALARDTVDLITGPRRAQLRVCDRPGHCDWVFLDTTRNHSRKYCTEGCAMHERVTRHKLRSKGEQ